MYLLSGRWCVLLSLCMHGSVETGLVCRQGLLWFCHNAQSKLPQTKLCIMYFCAGDDEQDCQTSEKHNAPVELGWLSKEKTHKTSLYYICCFCFLLQYSAIWKHLDGKYFPFYCPVDIEGNWNRDRDKFCTFSWTDRYYFHFKFNLEEF